MVKFLDKNSGFNQWNANNSAAGKKPRFSGVLWWIILFLISWWLVSIWFGPKKNVDNAPAPAPVADLSAVPAFDTATDNITARIKSKFYTSQTSIIFLISCFEEASNNL